MAEPTPNPSPTPNPAPAPNPSPTPEPAPAPTPTPAPTPDPPLTATAVFEKLGSWQALIPDDFEVEFQGKKIPAKDVPFFKEPKTFGDFLARAMEQHKEIGARVKIPGKDATPEEKAAFVKRLNEAGIMPAPKAIPEDPTKYEITPPPEFGELNKDSLEKVRAILHEEGVSQEGAKKLLDVYFEGHKDIVPLLDDLKGLVPTLKTVKEDAKKQFEDEIRGNGQDPERALATIGRFAAKKFSADQIASLGDYGNHPLVLRMLYDLALANREDFGPIKIDAQPVIHDQEAQKELDEIHTMGSEKNKIWLSRGPEGDRMRERAMTLLQKVTGGR